MTNSAEWPVNRKAAVAFAALASLFSFASFSGWVFHSRVLRAFGTTGLPISPMSAIGYFTLSLGFVFAIRGEPVRARLTWAITLLIAGLTVFQNLSGISLGTDGLLFPEGVKEFPFAHPGRPGVTSTTIFLLLVFSGYLATSRHLRGDKAGDLIASGVLCAVSATMVLILFMSPTDPVAKQYTLSVPATLIGLSLLVAFVLWQSDFAWVRLLSTNREEPPVLQSLLPAVLLLPLVPSLLGQALEAGALLTPLGQRLMVLILNIALVGLITYGAVRRAGHDRAMLLEMIEALRATETRLSTAIDAARLGIFEWEISTGQFYWSVGTEERLGVVPGSLPNFDAWAATIVPEDLEIVMRRMDEAIARQADGFSFRYRFRQVNGTVSQVEGSAAIFYDGKGELARAVGVLLNMTEQEEREMALRGREAQLRSILDTVPDPLVVTDEAGTIRQFSAAAQALWGYSPEEIIGRDYRLLSPKEDFEENAAKLALYVESNGVISETITAVGEAKDGRRFPVELRVGLARVDGKLLITIFARDMTKQLASEERLSELSSELAHVSRLSAMSELAANLAHELNQPLSAAANFLAAGQMLIERGEDVERVGELLGMANEQTLRAGEIIRRLRAFMARGEVELRPESVEQTVRDAAELGLVGTGPLHIRVDFKFDREVGRMLADRIQVQQVLVNLLRNSVDALRSTQSASRQIIVSARKVSENMVEIEIADTGPGMPESVLQQLFSRFSTTKGERGGMGIGLSISKRIIKAHGGELKAENRLEGGASFRFTIPAVEEVEA